VAEPLHDVGGLGGGAHWAPVRRGVASFQSYRAGPYLARSRLGEHFLIVMLVIEAAIILVPQGASRRADVVPRSRRH
jgi:hypothetical protein